MVLGAVIGAWLLALVLIAAAFFNRKRSRVAHTFLWSLLTTLLLWPWLFGISVAAVMVWYWTRGWWLGDTELGMIGMLLAYPDHVVAILALFPLAFGLAVFVTHPRTYAGKNE